MKKKIIGVLICTLLVIFVFQAAGTINKNGFEINNNTRLERDYGDAPEGDGAVAYPSLGITGSFPTCQSIGPALWVQHNNFGAWFGQGVDFEQDGNGGTCPQCFPPYDQDEGYMDSDAGLIIPEPFTIDNTITVVPFPGFLGTPLGSTGQTAVWGVDIDIHVHNFMPSQWEGYFNLIIDWNQNGKWGDPGEHVIVNFWPIPNPYDGPISGLSIPNFVIGPNPGYVWARFTISEKPVPANWIGAEDFEDGESEDYLLQIIKEHIPIPDLDCSGSLTWTKVKLGATVTGTFKVKNIGDPGSLLNWEVNSWPIWGTWTFSPSNGTGLPKGGETTITATCIAPNEKNKPFSGSIELRNKNDYTDKCTIPVSLTTPKYRFDLHLELQQFFEKMYLQFPILRLLI